MAPITARDFMSPAALVFRPGADVLEAVRALIEHSVSGVPVVDSRGRYRGMFTERCAMQVMLDAAYEPLPVTDVASFMDRDAQTIGPDTQLMSVAQVFLLTPFRRLPVLEKGKLIGMVSRQDVLRCWSGMLEAAQADSRESVLVHFSEMFEWGEAPLA
jgi:CBS domain-containing protein